MKHTIQSDQAKTLGAFYQGFIERGDVQRAEKVIDLIEKFQQKTFTICFTGHFSAGKSSIINRLMNEKLLPESPIPTSANIVNIQKGNGIVRAYTYDGKAYEFQEPYTEAKLSASAKDKQTIKRIDIFRSETHLPEGIILTDTPGIDSSDDADRAITESSLHTVDMMYYVTDYNHVQSEVNLLFMQKLHQAEQPFALVINQIDKHQEQELAFEVFKQSTEAALQSWSINPVKIYYTSAAELEHPKNQFQLLQEDIFKLIEEKDLRWEAGVKRGLNQLTKSHLKEKEQAFEEEKQSLQAKRSQPDYQAEEHYQQSKERLQEAKAAIEQTIAATIQNAILMPYEVRNAAHRYLESTFPDFKVGFIGAKKKTAAEKAARLQTFYDLLAVQMEETLRWRLRDKLAEWAAAYHLMQKDMQDQIQNFSISFTAERLERLVRSGASLSGEYTLVYTRELEQEVKKSYKQKALSLAEDALERLRSQAAADRKAAEKESLANQKAQDLEEKLSALSENFNAYKESFIALYEEGNVTLFEQAVHQLPQRYQIIEEPLIDYESETEEEADIVVGAAEQEKTLPSAAAMIANINEAEALLQHYKGFSSILESLASKREKLTHKNFSTVLFGAFSAGKSSFSNSLLGQQLLPVSPNPTTAAINIITAPTAEYPHKTVLVEWKTEERLLDDLNSVKAETKETLETTIAVLDPNLAADQRQEAFIRGVAEGYETVQNHLGKKQVIPFEAFHDHVTKEYLSCFIHQITVYLNNKLLMEGVSLIDTPGADSVNARHTDTAFQYMKHADVILFVTYYNHAFSKADERVLRQLGNVKDAREKDNMFFILNAKDLAKDHTELKMVSRYVTDNLRNFDIRNPQLFPVSSHQAMIEKSTGEDLHSGMAEVENALFHYLEYELTNTIIFSALQELERAVQALNSYLIAASSDEQEKHLSRKQYQKEEEMVLKTAAAFHQDANLQAVEQKIQKQFYYVKDRLLLRFYDLFKTFFSPAEITAGGAEGRKEVNKQVQELLEELYQLLKEEVQAISLRAEQTLLQQSSRWLDALSEALYRSQETIRLHHPDIEIPELETELVFRPFEDKELQQISSVFKSVKAFFQGDDRDKLKEKLLPFIKEKLETAFQACQQEMEQHFRNIWVQTEAQLRHSAQSDIAAYYEGMQAALAQDTDLSQLKQDMEKLSQIARTS